MACRKPRTERQIALFNERMAAAVLRDFETYAASGTTLADCIELRQENFRPWLYKKFGITPTTHKG